MITASERLVRIPAKIWGSAAGRTRRVIRSCLGMQYDRDVAAELREEPQVAELDHDRGRAREVAVVRARRPELPRKQDRQRHGDLRADLQSAIGAGAQAAVLCDGCHRSARFSIRVKTMWI